MEARGLGFIVPLKLIEYGVYGDLTTIYPKPYSIYLNGTMGSGVLNHFCGAGFGN